jgi:hypothetical protein
MREVNQIFDYFECINVVILIIFSVLSIAGVDPSLTTQIEEILLAKNTKHTTSTNNDSKRLIDQIRRDPLLMDYIYKIYYLDLVHFNFSLY